MEENKVAQSFVAVAETVIPQPLPILKQSDIPKPALAGIIYGEIVFWILILSLLISIPGFIMYMTSGGYLDSAKVLNQLWQGSDPLTIWKVVGNLNQPLLWYDSIGLVSKGDMLATLGISVTGIAAVFGMWGAFVGTIRSKGGIYILFALIIAVVLTLSALGILKIQM